MHRRFAALLFVLTCAIGLFSAGLARAAIIEEGPAVVPFPTTTASGIDQWKSVARGDAVTLDAVAAAGDTLISTAYQWAGDSAWTVNGAGGATALSTIVSGWLPGDHSLDGVRTLRFYSTGQMGGDEAVQEAPVGIDTTAPSASIGTYDVGWSNESVTVPVLSEDPGWPSSSGVLLMWVTRVGSVLPPAHYAIPALPGNVPGAPQLFQGQIPSVLSHTVQAESTHVNDGIRTFQFWPQDLAGNVGGTVSATVRIDTLAPVSSSSGWDPDTTYGEPVVVTLGASDPYPPIESVTAVSGVEAIYHSVDGADVTRYAGPVTVDGEGPTTLAYYAVDRAGNVELTRRATILFEGDHQPAIAFLSPPFCYDVPGFNPGIVGPSIFRLMPTDPVDGILSVEAWTTVVTAEDPPTEPPTPIAMMCDAASGEWYGQIPAGLDGHYVLHVRATDEAGLATEVARPFVAGWHSDGLEQPLSMDGSASVRFGSVVPLRLHLSEWGAPVTDLDILPPTLTVEGLHPGSLAAAMATGGRKVRGGTGYTFAYRGNGLWTLNWNTADLATLVSWWGAAPTATVELRVHFGGDTWLTTLVSVSGAR